MAKFITAKEAAQLIPDHATVGVAGMGLSGWPEEIACAIRDSFAETGHPCDLNLKQASALGDWGYGNKFQEILCVLGPVPDFFLEHWCLISAVVQFMISLVLLFISARRIKKYYL